MAPTDSVWVEAERSAMKKNSNGVVSKVPEAAGIGFEDLDLGVEAFGSGICDRLAIPADDA